MELVRENAGHIFRKVVLSDRDPVCFSVNFPLYPFTGLTRDLLHEQMNVVFNVTRGKFRVNVGVTRILRHKVTAELKLFRGEHDKECLLYRDDIDREANIASKCAYPGVLKSRADIDKLVERLLSVDWLEHMTQQRENTSWQFVTATNIRYFVSETEVIKYGRQNIRIPDYIKRNKAVITMEKSDSGKNALYDDNLCFFRSLAYLLLKSKKCERLTKCLCYYWLHRQHNEEGRVIPLDVLARRSISLYSKRGDDAAADDDTGSIIPIVNIPPGSVDGFEGVTFDDLPELEEYFSLSLDIFQLLQPPADGMTDTHSVQHIYKTNTLNKTSVYMNLYVPPHEDEDEEEDEEDYVLFNEGHLMPITNIELYASVYTCKCGKTFKTLKHLKQHQDQLYAGEGCDGRTRMTKHVYTGGFKRDSVHLFERIRSYGVDPPTQFYDKFICYDFEAILAATDLEVKEGDKTKYKTDHIPVSFSIGTNLNLDNDDVKCYVDRQPKSLINTFIAKCEKLAKVIRLVMKYRYGPVLDELKQKYNHHRAECESHRADMQKKEQDQIDEGVEEIHVVVDAYDKHKLHFYSVYCEQLRKCVEHLEQYINTVPVIGFNSAKYDFTLIRDNLVQLLLQIYDEKEVCVIKQGSAYSMVEVRNHFRFLDMWKFCSPGTSLDKFIRTQGASAENKGFFPYEWFDSVDKLDEVQLPPSEAFYSSLKAVNTLGNTPEEIAANYALCQQAWNDNQMQTMQCYLKYYNILDVRPFIRAVEKWMNDYHMANNLDVLKECQGAPSIARRMLFKEAGQTANFQGFSLSPLKHADIEGVLNANIVGGPSIIYTRKMVAGESKMERGGATCQSIVGWDANALYAYCMTQDMPVGPTIRWNWTTNEDLQEVLKPELTTGAHISRLAYYFFSTHERSAHIKTLFNTGKEIRIGGFYCDGVDLELKVIHEVQGCYYHNHNCVVRELNEEQQAMMEDRSLRTATKKALIEYVTGFKVEHHWECQILSSQADKKAYNACLPNFYRYNRNKEVKTETMLAAVQKGDFFGGVEVDIHVPPEHYPDFEEMCPLFMNSEIPFDSLSEEIQDYIKQAGLSQNPRKQLVGGLKAERVLISSPMLKWYLDHGLVVTQIYQAFEWYATPCFKPFMQSLERKRRMATFQGDAAEADKVKLIGNSCYGVTAMNKDKFVTTKFCGVDKIGRFNDNELFRMSRAIGAGVYEVVMSKAKQVHDLPRQVPWLILQMAKLRMLQFYYDFLVPFIGQSQFEMVEMDTDSLYFGLTHTLNKDRIKLQKMILKWTDQQYANVMENYDNAALHESLVLALQYHPLMSLIKEDKVDQFNHMLFDNCVENWHIDYNTNFFPRQCCTDHFRYDSKTVGLFKLEWSGEKMIALCSKTYCGVDFDGGEKLSAKGAQKSLLPHGSNFDVMKDVLTNEEPFQAEIMGFREKGEKVRTYSMLKNVFTHMYTKRELMPDKIHTKPYYDHILKHNAYVIKDFKRDKKRLAIEDRGEMDIWNAMNDDGAPEPAGIDL